MLAQACLEPPVKAAPWPRAALGGPAKRAVRGCRDGFSLGDHLGFAPGGRDPAKGASSCWGSWHKTSQALIHLVTLPAQRGQGTCTAPFSFPFWLPLSCSRGDFASSLPQPVEGGLGRAARCLRGVMSLGGTGWRKENLRHPVCLAELTEPCVLMLRNKTTPKAIGFPC